MISYISIKFGAIPSERCVIDFTENSIYSNMMFIIYLAMYYLINFKKEVK